jgi:phosphoglycolate phosphatase-like HAD superfamily hydrolase
LERFIDFGIGAYGEDNSDRAELVAIAQGRAGKRHRAAFDSSNTVLIGDTAHDVAAAHDGGARIIAVASGKTTAHELERAGAEVVLGSLLEWEGLVGGLGV